VAGDVEDHRGRMETCAYAAQLRTGRAQLLPLIVVKRSRYVLGSNWVTRGSSGHERDNGGGRKTANLLVGRGPLTAA